jgi:hypothetical protein
MRSNKEDVYMPKNLKDFQQPHLAWKIVGKKFTRSAR